LTVELESLADLEPALAAEGFFGRDDVFAHVYVGYRDSDSLRRGAGPPPPGPRRSAAAVTVSARRAKLAAKRPKRTMAKTLLSPGRTRAPPFLLQQSVKVLAPGRLAGARPPA